MILGRPGSHILMMLYFLAMASVTCLVGNNLLQKGDPMYKGEFLLAAPYVVALISMQSKSRWSYYLCAVLSFMLPAFLVGTMLLLFFKVASVTFNVLAPSIVEPLLLFVLCCRFTFGRASRDYYGFKPAKGSGDPLQRIGSTP